MYVCAGGIRRRYVCLTRRRPKAPVSYRPLASTRWLRTASYAIAEAELTEALQKAQHMKLVKW